MSHTFLTLGMYQFKELFEWYSEFEDDLSNPETYPIAVFWNSYVEMVQTIRDFVKPIKTGDWGLNLFASDKILHWFHTYDNYNYARHFSYHWASQQALAQDHPSIFQHFKEGGFLIQESSTKSLQIRPLSNPLAKIKKVEVI